MWLKKDMEGRFLTAAVGACALVVLFMAPMKGVLAQEDVAPSDEMADLAPPTVSIPIIDPVRGRVLFVQKGCVVCHSVNGVGGLAAPSLDAPGDSRSIDLLDFSARMWRGSLAMVELQAAEFAYQIELTGNEIGDLAAFAYDIEEQKKFSMDEVPEYIQDWLLKEPMSVEDDFFE